MAGRDPAAGIIRGAVKRYPFISSVFSPTKRASPLNTVVGGLGLAPLLARGGQGVNALPDPSGDPVPVEARNPGGNPQRRCHVNRLGHLSGVDKHFGGDAPTVEIGAAKRILLDDGNRPARVVRARDGSPGTCPHNNAGEIIRGLACLRRALLEKKGLPFRIGVGHRHSRTPLPIRSVRVENTSMIPRAREPDT